MKAKNPVTLLTAQWGDLPFEEVCKLASKMGYDGLEIGCGGDHMDVVRAATDLTYVEEKKALLEKYHPYRLSGALCHAPSRLPLP